MTARNGALEAIEDALLRFRCDADALVTHRQLDVALPVGEDDANRLARRVLDRVADQVGDDLVDAGRIEQADAVAFVLEGQDATSLLRLDAEGVDARRDQLVQVDALELDRKTPRQSARDIEQTVDPRVEPSYL